MRASLHNRDDDAGNGASGDAGELTAGVAPGVLSTDDASGVVASTSDAAAGPAAAFATALFGLTAPPRAVCGVGVDSTEEPLDTRSSAVSRISHAGRNTPGRCGSSSAGFGVVSCRGPRDVYPCAYRAQNGTARARV